MAKNPHFSSKKCDAIFEVKKSGLDAIFEGLLLNKKLVIQKDIFFEINAIFNAALYVQLYYVFP